MTPLSTALGVAANRRDRDHRRPHRGGRPGKPRRDLSRERCSRHAQHRKYRRHLTDPPLPRGQRRAQAHGYVVEAQSRLHLSPHSNPHHRALDHDGNPRTANTTAFSCAVEAIMPAPLRLLSALIFVPYFLRKHVHEETPLFATDINRKLVACSAKAQSDRATPRFDWLTRVNQLKHPNVMAPNAIDSRAQHPLELSCG